MVETRYLRLRRSHLVYKTREDFENISARRLNEVDHRSHLLCWTIPRRKLNINASPAHRRFSVLDEFKSEKLGGAHLHYECLRSHRHITRQRGRTTTGTDTTAELVFGGR
uniref:Uncharacterized protein n=2 Tax=Sipha flava TaxID=143950 RepID=A0A2S2QTS5_9HEMI